jgi:class 3 adenylate cyclase
VLNFFIVLHLKFALGDVPLMILFFAKKERPKLKSLYQSWQESNKPNFTQVICLSFMFFMAFLIPFDFLLFGLDAPYPKYRIASLMIFSICYMLLGFFSRSKKIDRDRSIGGLLIFLNVYWNVLYHYFLCIATPEDLHIVLMGNLMVTFFSSFLLQRFWREQYALNFLGIVALFALSFSYPERVRELQLLIVCHFVSFFLMFFMRREFAGALYERYYHLIRLIPKQVAHSILTSSGSMNLSEAFKARKCFTVCLVSDMRNYQELFRHKSPEKVSEILESFYNIVFECLEQTSPEGNYFANWTADELFIIFYNEKNNSDVCMLEALSFSKLLATSIHQRVSNELNLPLTWDIGLACGDGLLGVQGPKSLKKTTIIGSTPGQAKRLETEAKLLRQKTFSQKEDPLLLMDEKLKSFAISSKCFELEDLSSLTATVKNISGETCYVFSKSSSSLFKLTS